ncbi:MAG: hypothetical protein HFF03_03230 [Oscillospiraceae bacterium]|jgi:hypothetical protein|nr:hypothetical protein [Oscillospiraceae bacterium]
MRKKQCVLALALGLSLALTACGPKEAAVPSTTLPPVTEACRARMDAVTVPDFLNEEQQEQYRFAHYLYGHMFGGETTAVEELFPLVHVPVEGYEGAYTYESVEYGKDFFYYRSTVPYADFDAAVRSVFTDRFWEERSGITEGQPIYADLDGTLIMAELSRGAGYFYNENFPDEFRLEEQTEDKISFTLIGHYSPVWPKEGESYEERDARLLSGYEYTHEFPITMVLTEKGWRFDTFHTALADEVSPDDI